MRGDLKGHSEALNELLDAQAFRDAVRKCCRPDITEAEAASIFEHYRVMISDDIADDDETNAPLEKTTWQ